MNLPRPNPTEQVCSPAWWQLHWQTLVNILLYFILGEFTLRMTIKVVHAGHFDLLYWVATAKAIIGLWVILIRRDYKEFDFRGLAQFVALAAFFSGVFFVKVPANSGIICTLGLWLLILGVVIVALSLVSLGPSFGVLIARREVRTTYLFRWIRHPMYSAELLKRVGVVMLNSCWWNWILAIFSSALYVYRAELEEQFLKKSEEYRAYCEKIPCKFIPGLW